MLQSLKFCQPLVGAVWTATRGFHQGEDIRMTTGSYTLELFHVADQEASAAAVVDAPNLSAVLNILRGADLHDDGLPDNTLTLSSGDAFIPGLFFSASEAVYGTGGLADIVIQNELGFQAIALGNHEFDFGPAVLAALIDGSAPGDILGADFAGTAFPYLSTNLDFSTDPDMAPLVVAGGGAPQPNTVTSSVVIGVNGEQIGVVGATTPTLDIISSPGNVTILPADFDPDPTEAQLDALAAEIQSEVDALIAANPGMNKVVLLAHMQQLDIELALAERLENVDIIVAGGSNTRLFDETDVIRPGDSAQGLYPTFVTNAGGTQTAVVNTDGSYKYLGRLVVDFDESGNVVAESYDPDLSGAFATNAAGLFAVSDGLPSGLEMEEAQQVGEVPDTAAAGTVSVTAFDAATGTVTIEGSYSGLTSALAPVGGTDAEGNPQSAVHIHTGAPGENGGILRNLAVTETDATSGTFAGTFTMSETELLTLLKGGAYINLHTADNPAGELRAQVEFTANGGAITLGEAVDPEVAQIAGEIGAQIVATESNVFGEAAVFLNANRSGTGAEDDPDGVRTQETNLGNLSADANLAIAKATDDSVLVSIKNGGGIRASIGETVVPPGGTGFVRTPNSPVFDADGNLVKPEGGISQTDIETTLAFNNGLSLLTLTRAELVGVLEHGVGALPGVSGRFIQVSGVQFSVDETQPAGERIVNAAIVDEDGRLLDLLVQDGEIQGDAAQTVRIVTLNFLAGGGDGYPFPAGEDADRVDLYADAIRTGEATFADDGTEQDAMAEFLADTYSGRAYREIDTGPEGDGHIQQLAYREDTALRTTIALDDLDGTRIGVIDGPDGDFFLDGGAGDAFGLGSLADWPGSGGVPFSLVDDTRDPTNPFEADREAVFGENADAANVFFGISDSDEFGEAQTVSWTFDISDAEDLFLSIDMGGMSDGTSFGGFVGQTAGFTYSIDGGPAQSAFDIAATTDLGGFEYRPMDNGADVEEGGVLQVTGANQVSKINAETGAAAGDTFLDRASLTTGLMDTFTTALDGAGTSLTLTFTADFPFEAMAFDNLLISGTDLAPGADDDPIEPVPAAQTLIIGEIGRIADLAGAEIVDFDPQTGRAFVTSGDGLQVIDASDPAAPVLVATITPTSDGFATDDITSVTVKNGIVAVALPAATATDPGEVLFYDTAGTFLNSVTVGALPDMVTFDETGTYVVVANEGESAGEDNEPDATPNPEGSVSVIDLSGGVAQASVTTLGFNDASITLESLAAKGVRVFDSAPSAAADLEPEYIAIEGTTAYITLQENNAVAVIADISNPTDFTIDDILPLGAKDHSLPGNELDPSDRDDGINLGTYPVFGLYMPDSVAAYTVNGQQYFVTANEGDARASDARIADVTLDPEAFPNAAFLQDEAVLGRLDISTIDGDTDGDGDFDALYAYGARSFTIWDAAGNVVFDSGSEFARIIATDHPEIFNANDGDPAEFDSRSDAKGAEPEALTIGEIDGATYAFIGLERVGGIMVYDITDPSAPVFDQYIYAPDDVAPEGLRFIAAEDSPTGAALLAVANEDSNSLTFHQFNATTAISAVQGAGAESPLAGDTVIVEAVVTGDFQTGDGDASRDLGGFWLMEEVADRDDDDATSEGIFVSEGDLLTDVALGDLVSVRGTVAEEFGRTVIRATDVKVLEAGAVSDISTLAVSTGLPAPEGREALEGMLLDITEPLTFIESFDYEEAGAALFAAGGPVVQFSQQNAPDAAANAAYLEAVDARTILIDDGLDGTRADGDPVYWPDGSPFTFDDALRMGQAYSDVTGIMDYGTGAYRLRIPLDDSLEADPGSNPRPATPDDVGGRLQVASLNVLNYFTTLSGQTDVGADPRGAESAAEFARQEAKLVEAILSTQADVIGLMEIENDFAGDSFAIRTLVDAVNAELGSADWAFVDPGREFVGNDAIAVGFIYDTTKVGLTGQTAILDDPSFLDPLDDGDDGNGDETPNGDAWNRAAVAQSFTEIASGESFTAVVNHFKSKGSLTGAAADEDQGDGAGNNNATRAAASQALLDWLATDPTGAGDADTLILGDLNAYAEEDPITILEGAGYNDLAQSFDPGAHSYRFSGAIGTLDYILGNGAISPQVTGATIWNINSDEPFLYDYNLDGSFTPVLRPTDQGLFDANSPAKSSDHDPVIIGLNLGTPSGPTRFDDTLVGSPVGDTIDLLAGNDAYSGLGGDDVIIGGPGDDTIDGGEGRDTAVYGADSTGFTLRLDPGGIAVEDRSGALGTDALTSVEALDFLDTDLPLDLFTGATAASAEILETVSGLYAAYLGRLPDALGLAYYAARLAEGGSAESVAEVLYEAAAAEGRFDGLDTPGALVDFGYDALFGRPADTAGRDFWTGVIESGNVEEAAFLAQLAAGAQGGDATVLSQQAELGIDFAGINGLGDVDLARDILTDFLDGADTFAEASAAIATAFNAASGSDDGGLLVQFVGLQEGDPALF